MQSAPGMEELLASGRLSELYQPASRFLRAYLKRLITAWYLPAELLGDALQETFVRIIRYHGRYNAARSAARTWLMMLARQALVDLTRRHNAGKMKSLYGKNGELAWDPEGGGTPADSGEAASLIQAALETMSPRHREAVRLRLEGNSQKEVAAELGLTPGNVGVIFHHFRQKVEELVG